MNRRSFLSIASVLAAMIPAAAVTAKASEQFGRRIDSMNPPEPGFEYMGSRRYKVFWNGEELAHVIRVDTGRGVAWCRQADQDGKLIVHRDENNRFIGFEDVEVHGRITLERIA